MQTRRQFLCSGSCFAAGLFARPALATTRTTPKTVAAVATVYRKNSHADVILTKILKGWKHDGGPGPNLTLASLYVEQVGDDDMSHDLSREFGFPITKTIPEAITLGSDKVAVDGVLSIGEHGEYPWNELGQHLYPRRRFFAEILNTFERCDKVVPVFNDKHPGPVWEDANWMYRRSKEMHVPWMAGSSLPVSFRDPDITISFGRKVEACLAVGYSGLDVYGFHTLDFLQCLLERRGGAEHGVSSVQSLPTTSLESLMDKKRISRELLEAGLKSSRTDLSAVLNRPPKDGSIFLIQYTDGLVVPVLMLPGLANGISVAFQLAGEKTVQATRTEERPEPRYPHFAYLLKGIEQMVHTGRPAYPVERTILTAGMLDRLLNSRAQNGVKLETPELAISYQPVDYGHAPHIDLSQAW